MSNSSSGVFDSTQTHDYFFFVSERIYVTVQFALWLHFREFMAPATAATSAGSSTSGSGGSSTPTSGASSAASSASGGSSTPTSGASSASSSSNEAGATDSASHDPAIPPYVHDHGVVDHSHTIAHTHVVTIGAHDHTIAHTHNVTIAAHDHTTPDHGHGLIYGIFKETMPGSIDVVLGLWRKPFEGGAWELVTSISGLDQTEVYLDLTPYFDDDPSGLWRLTFQSAPGQPNGGRLTVDVAHDGYGAIKSA